MPRALLVLLPLLGLLVPQRSHAEPTGLAYHGAGGPFAGAIGFFPRGNAPLALMTTGGYGYTYLFDGRFRLGGGGQGTVLSSTADGRHGSLGWGSLHLAWDPAAEGRWEFPLALSVGGGRASLERELAGGLVERESQVFMALQVSASVEYRLVRTVKLALMASWVGGVADGGLSFQALEGSLRLVFLLPRPGR
jgi:hypothetical protein